MPQLQTANSVAILNRMFRMLYRSLPVYLERTSFWSESAGLEGRQLLLRLAADQRALAARVAEAIKVQGRTVEPGHFPVAFSGLHDLDLAYILGRIRQDLERDLPVFKDCVYTLASAPALQPLAADVLRTTQEYLAALKQLAPAG